MKKKKETLYAVEITIASLVADSDRVETTKEEYYNIVTNNLIGGLLSAWIEWEIVGKHGLEDTCMKEVEQLSYLALSGLRKALFSTLHQPTEDSSTSSWIYRGLQNGLQNFMKQLNALKTDSSTTQDTKEK